MIDFYDPANYTWRPAPDDLPEPYPAPEVTSRDGHPVPEKGAVSRVLTLALGKGWDADVTYARGHLPHATTARPLTCRGSIAVRLTRDGVRAVAVYREGSSSWAWDTMYVGTQRFTGIEEWEGAL